MPFLPLLIFSLLFSLYGIVAKRLKWIYWLNSMNNVIPPARRATIDWEGYSNVMGNIIAISCFLLIFGCVVLTAFHRINYFPIVLVPFIVLLIWGQYGYGYRRFDKQAYSEEKREKMKSKVLEYYNLDLVFTALSILLVGLGYLLK
jgi:hypothetical protein